VRRALAAFLLAIALAVSSASAEPRVYVVKPGESLWEIAGRTVGDPTLWPALYLANRDQIKDPTRVYPGQRLAIPDIPRTERASVRRQAHQLIDK
jgi:nucleoid-associated protein YgaU